MCIPIAACSERSTATVPVIMFTGPPMRQPMSARRRSRRRKQGCWVWPQVPRTSNLRIWSSVSQTKKVESKSKVKKDSKESYGMDQNNKTEHPSTFDVEDMHSVYIMIALKTHNKCPSACRKTSHLCPTCRTEWDRAVIYSYTLRWPRRVDADTNDHWASPTTHSRAACPRRKAKREDSTAVLVRW